MSKKRLLTIIGIVVAVVAIAVLLDATLANHRPAINGLEAEPERVVPRGICQIACNATDADDDELSYGWSADGGTIAVAERGDTITWSAPSAAGSYNITVIVTDGRGGVVTGYVIITVKTNRSPTINSLTANAEWTLPLGSLNVTCSALDSDDDVLSYEWSTSGGSIAGMGDEATWNAPQAVGIYDITVVVRDGHGSSNTATLPVSVVTGEPPNIEALPITAEHCYLRGYSWGYRVGKEKEYSIECVVSDTGIELVYEWAFTGGELSGDGSMVMWTAPTSGQVTVTVIVSDIGGNKAVKSLLLDVAGCTSCQFPGCTE